jgi:hypothetical protein
VNIRERRDPLSPLLAKSVLDRHLVADELQEVTASCSHFLTAKVRQHKIPFKGSNVACYYHFQIFKLAAGKAVEESLNTTTDLLLAKITLAKCIGAHRCMIDAILGKEAGEWRSPASKRTS